MMNGVLADGVEIVDMVAHYDKVIAPGKIEITLSTTTHPSVAGLQRFAKRSATAVSNND